MNSLGLFLAEHHIVCFTSTTARCVPESIISLVLVPDASPRIRPALSFVGS